MAGRLTESERKVLAHTGRCGKKSFRSRKEAKRVLRGVRRQRRFEAGDVYRCPWCSDPGFTVWHVTSNSYRRG